ncbi:alpha/beta fold hydrolase [Ilumatobacter nonamiensis]|uniref:alpha/beta fold hydrolase n=1 Tax=Ilumatobacter nonamiensis TaxID=467093 RepID=UPI00034B4E10|nr:alpha/beta hydrolase [Ilumatobacter nonamiensis]
MTTLRVSDIEIYYEVHGRALGEGDWVLNIGGTGGDLRQTFPDRSPLNDHFRVIHYDQRGLGRTSKPEVDYTMADYADDAAALIEQVAGGRCHVVGTSFGGMVALNLAVRHPELVDRLVLLVTSPGGDHASYALPELQLLDPAEAFTTRMRLLDERWDPDAEEPIPGLGAIYEFIVQQQQAVAPPHVQAGLDRQLAARDGHDVVAALGTIDLPTFVGAGRYDGLAPAANSEVLAERMPDARLEMFEGGHLVMFQDGRVWPAVIDFLSR